jgi:hypothetical protein
MLSSFIKLDAAGIEQSVTEWCKRMTKLAKSMPRDDLKGVAESSRAKLDEFKAYLPLIACICNLGMRGRHWQAISEVAGTLCINNRLPCCFSIFLFVFLFDPVLSWLLGLCCRFCLDCNIIAVLFWFPPFVFAVMGLNLLTVASISQSVQCNHFPSKTKTHWGQAFAWKSLDRHVTLFLTNCRPGQFNVFQGHAQKLYRPSIEMTHLSRFNQQTIPLDLSNTVGRGRVSIGGTYCRFHGGSNRRRNPSAFAAEQPPSA